MKSVPSIYSKIFAAALFTGLIPAAGAQPAGIECELNAQTRFSVQSAVADKQALGGFARSSNSPKPLPDEMAAEIESLELVLVESRTPEAKAAGAVEFWLVNGSEERQWFRAVDSHLPIVQEAKDSQGRWRAITAVPQSWCGNSYHRVALEPGQYWRLIAPRYDGSLETELRFRLNLPDGKSLYSEPYEGRVNPDRFLPLETDD